jgi:hypothetical protein
MVVEAVMEREEAWCGVEVVGGGEGWMGVGESGGEVIEVKKVAGWKGVYWML